MTAAYRHKVGGFNGTEVACECDRRWITRDQYAEHVAEHVLRLFVTAENDRGESTLPPAPAAESEHYERPGDDGV
jgi:hypothetical protein